MEKEQLNGCRTTKQICIEKLKAQLTAYLSFCFFLFFAIEYLDCLHSQWCSQSQNTQNAVIRSSQISAAPSSVYIVCIKAHFCPTLLKLHACYD